MPELRRLMDEVGAGIVQVGTVKLRAVSGLTTAGLGNPLVAAGELVGAVATALAAILLPLLAMLFLLVFLGYVIWRLLRSKPTESPG